MGTTTRTIRSPNGKQSVSLAVVTALAETEGVQPVDIPPVSEHIDLEALENLIESADADVTVSFSVDDHEITVTGDKTVTID